MYKYFFTDETKIDTAQNTSNESIRISSKVKNKWKTGIKEGYKLISKEKKVWAINNSCWRVSYYGLSDLILLKGKMRGFSYSQVLEYYKDNFENFKNK